MQHASQCEEGTGALEEEHQLATEKTPATEFWTQDLAAVWQQHQRHNAPASLKK